MSKTSEWWAKDWMERHTHILPRYDDDGRMKAQGHALAAEAGADVPTFHDVMVSLRDVQKNPEWRFVREGPLWHGRRVATWDGLVALGS